MDIGVQCYLFNGRKKKLFWEIQTTGKEIKIRQGHFNEIGGIKKVNVSTRGEAVSKTKKLVREKLMQGFKPTKHTIKDIFDNIDAVDGNPICSMFAAEDADLEVIKDFCNYLNVCIAIGLRPKEFSEIYVKFVENKDEEFIGSVALANNDELWTDYLTDIDELDDFYKRAVRGHADRFIVFIDHQDEKSYSYIVAARGDAGAKEIESCALGEPHCKDEDGKCRHQWPSYLISEAPIYSITLFPDSAEIIFRDGGETKVEI